MNATDNNAGNKDDQCPSPHILIVDDEAPLRAMLRELFEGEGFVVSEARDGREGLTQAEQVGYDNLSVIVLDLIMPKVGGLAFIRKVHEVCPTNCPPILICTARRERAMVNLAKERKVHDYILKPYGMAVMLKRVKTLMLQPRGSAERS